MKVVQSIEIIETMFMESKKSLRRSSFYFILWGLIMAPAGIAESLLIGKPNSWLIWPVIGVVGGLVSMIYGWKEEKRSGISTFADRIVGYTWGSFVFCLVLWIVYSVANQLPPHTIVLMLAGMATFITGGICSFKPFVWGGILIELGAISCAFFVPFEFQGYVSAISLILGYAIPGFMLRSIENDKA